MASKIQPPHFLEVKGKAIATDEEGYIKDFADWTEDYALALAEREELALTDEHWEVIRFIRDFHEEHGIQAQVREMIRHFKKAWGPERGNNHYLHQIFPKGGPQKQGNRLAGVHRPRGEH